MKKLKRIISITMAVMLTVPTLNVFALQDKDIKDIDVDRSLDIKISEKKEEDLISKNTTYTLGDYEFSVSGTNATITSYSGTAETLNIPSTLNYDGKTYKVTDIGKRAFYKCQLKNITIPNGVTSIGEEAFWCSYSLKNITLPNSITSIGNKAFKECSALESVTLPNKIKSINSEVFYNCYSLKKIVIPNSVTSIGDSAFAVCRALTDVNLSNNITSIGSSAFSNCTGLTKINIPNKIKSIPNFFIAGCYNLTNITIPSSVTNIGDGSFQQCSKLTSIKVPGSVTSIGSNAFWNSKSLKKIIIPKSVTKIGFGAFAICDLLNVYVEKGSYAESYCKENKVPYKILVTSIALSAKSKTLTYGQAFNVKATLKPDSADNKGIKWSSNNSKVIAVITNKVMLKDCGEATVTATTVDGSNLSALVKITVVPQKVKKLTLTAGKKQATIIVSKTAGAKKYGIYRSTKKTSGFKKIATTTKTKYINKNLQSKKTYYYKVRGISGAYKGAFSTVKQVKVK